MSTLGRAPRRVCLVATVTVERQRGAKLDNHNSETRKGKLAMVEPCAEDWHCLMDFMIVRKNAHTQLFKAENYMHIIMTIIILI